jgi:hypothetical protein
MARVTRDGGVVAACAWDIAGGNSPISPFWAAVHELDPTAEGEAQRAGTRPGHLTELFEQSGLAEVEETSLPVDVEHAAFDEWWAPFTLGVGPAGQHYTSLPPDKQQALERLLRAQLGDRLSFNWRAWAARGRHIDEKM